MTGEPRFDIRTTPEQLRAAVEFIDVPGGDVDLIVDDRMLVARQTDVHGTTSINAWDTGGEPATEVYLNARLWEEAS